MILAPEKIKVNLAPPALALIRWACFFIFAGRAWQHLFWDAPFRALLWDQDLMQGIIEGLTSLTWEAYSSSTKVESVIQFSIRATGCLYVVCAFLSIFLSKNNKSLGKILILGAASLFILSILNCKEKFFQLGELMEHAIQVLSPLLLYAALYKQVSVSQLIRVSKIAIACTFIGHGLYAVNYYPQPGPYADMIINVFHFEEERSKNILVVLGFLDFIFSLLLFVPSLSALALFYCAIWGLLTALARVVAGFDSHFVLSTLNQYAFETVFRLAHFILPLWVLSLQGKLSTSFFLKRSIAKLQVENQPD
jgi:hypothetical protein